MISERYIEWWKTQDNTSKHSFIKDKAIQLNKYHKILKKSLEAELEYGFNRIGIRGGKFTSLNAKACNNSKMYYNCLEELQYMIKTV